ncbi:chromate efflux transporter [Tepidiphilus thermophilus]|uniref:Chromate transporter, chromate ion transporter (CHR) family n=1 Tax=Tepidiphilus thermophilus TaxID=876478 RepID=A0A0K6IUZ2_9PROT|nr:chromate efflux transporter [Tepidiphilus thermophilus]CUB06913.1 chromate transporter, chromate ion transporter (CHR) family [Tepidiphilus thermophilus]
MNGERKRAGAWDVLFVFLRLGLTSFGGPIAHLGYFREEFVVRRGWLDEREYADLVALCQFLPGPASSQVGMALGYLRAGYGGALAAWLGFTLPSAVAMILFALGLTHYAQAVPAGVLHGLKVAAVAVVAQAVWGMARTLCPDARRVTLMTVAACCVALAPLAWVQVAVIAAAGVAGLALLPGRELPLPEPLPIAVRRRTGLFWLALFAALLMVLPLLAHLTENPTLTLVDAFYRAGALVFGGGHVVLPLLQAETVPRGWVDAQTFLAGYGAAQAVPGPLFTFAAFLGAVREIPPAGWTGGLLALTAIFLPSFFLILGALPFWAKWRHLRHTQAALAGVNAAVVGLLLAALYQPVWTSAILRPQDFCLALVAFVALLFWRVPPWAVVGGCGFLGGVLG